MKYKTLLTAMIIAGMAVFFSTLPTASHAGHVPETRAAAPQTDADSSLRRGRTLLRQGRADQAITHLESALSAFTQANNKRGIAASEDALGDLYLTQGQYKVSLEHYQKAYDSFVAARNKDQAAGT